MRDTEPYAVALVLTRRATSERHPGLVARRVETFEEYQARERCSVGGVRARRRPRSQEFSDLLPERFRETVNLMHAGWRLDRIFFFFFFFF